MNAHTARITDFAARVRAEGTNRTWTFDLAVGKADLYVCPQPFDVECFVTLRGVPMSVGENIRGEWKKIEQATAAILGVRWEP